MSDRPARQDELQAADDMMWAAIDVFICVYHQGVSVRQRAALVSHAVDQLGKAVRYYREVRGLAPPSLSLVRTISETDRDRFMEKLEHGEVAPNDKEDPS